MALALTCGQLTCGYKDVLLVGVSYAEVLLKKQHNAQRVQETVLKAIS